MLPMVGTQATRDSRFSRLRRSFVVLMTSIFGGARDEGRGVRGLIRPGRAFPSFLVPRPSPLPPLKAVFGTGESAGFHFGYEALDRRPDRSRAVHEILHETWLLAGIDIEHVVEIEDLPGAMRPRSDTHHR